MMMDKRHLSSFVVLLLLYFLQYLCPILSQMTGELRKGGNNGIVENEELDVKQKRLRSEFVTKLKKLSIDYGNVRGKAVLRIRSYTNKYLLDVNSLPCDNEGIRAYQGCKIYFYVWTNFLGKKINWTTPTGFLLNNSGTWAHREDSRFRMEVEIPIFSNPKNIEFAAQSWDEDYGNNNDDMMERLIKMPFEWEGKNVTDWIDGTSMVKKRNLDSKQDYNVELKYQYKFECYAPFGGMLCNHQCLPKYETNYKCNEEGIPICNEHYYPTGKCDIYCKAPDNQYKCDSQGKRLCNQYWEGSDCMTLKARNGTKYRGKIVMQIYEYDPAGGKDVFGQYCDGGQTYCEYYFNGICKLNDTQEYSSTQNFVTATYRVMTEKEDFIDLRSKLEVNIPVTLREEEYIMCTIEVMEDDNSYDDFMLAITMDFRKLKPKRYWKIHNVTMYSKKKLKVKYKLICFYPFEGDFCQGRVAE